MAYNVLSLFRTLSLGTHEGFLNSYVNGWKLSRPTVHVFTVTLDSCSNLLSGKLSAQNVLTIITLKTSGIVVFILRTTNIESGKVETKQRTRNKLGGEHFRILNLIEKHEH